MTLFWIIYILGVVATVLLFYFTLEKGTKVTVMDIAFILVISIFSLVSFIISLLFIYSDEIVFTKK